MATPLKPPPIYEDQLVASHNQRLWYLLLGAGGIIVALVVALCIVTTRPHATPYVIAVDKQGEPTGTIQPFDGHGQVSDSVLRYSLGEYIRKAFQITSVWNQNKTNLAQVYAMSTGQASQALTDYYRANHDANNPLSVKTTIWQGVQIVRVLHLPAQGTFQVDYSLDRHDNDRGFTGVRTNWRATMHVVQGKPTTDNQLGLWVTDLDFEPEAK